MGRGRVPLPRTSGLVLQHRRAASTENWTIQYSCPSTPATKGHFRGHNTTRRFSRRSTTRRSASFVSVLTHLRCFSDRAELLFHGHDYLALFIAVLLPILSYALSRQQPHRLAPPGRGKAALISFRSPPFDSPVVWQQEPPPRRWRCRSRAVVPRTRTRRSGGGGGGGGGCSGDGDATRGGGCVYTTSGPPPPPAWQR